MIEQIIAPFRLFGAVKDAPAETRKAAEPIDIPGVYSQELSHDE